MLRKIIFMLVLLCFVSSFVVPVFPSKIGTDERPITMRLETRLDNSILPDEPEVKSPEPVPINWVRIKNIPNASVVMSLVPIVASSSYIGARIYYTIDGGRLVAMAGKSTYAHATWNSTASTSGWHTIYVYAKTLLGTTVASTHIHVYVVRTYRYALYYEIDYMSGHYPPASVLTYMQNYWKAFAIGVSYKIDDLVADPTPTDGKITDSDFWQLEQMYNDVWKYDDRAFGSSSTGKYTSKEKWVLWGTWDHDSGVGGYCYRGVYNSTDFIAGNYILIADSMIDNWEAANAIPYEGGEAVVFMHEAGHSIGVGIRSNYVEVYDSDYYSVMALMRLQNCKNAAPYWCYSAKYWDRRDLSYYRVKVIINP